MLWLLSIFSSSLVSATMTQTAWSQRLLLEAQFFDVQHAAQHIDQEAVRLFGDGGRHTYTWELSKGSDVAVEEKLFHFHSSIDIESADTGHFLREVNLSFPFPFFGREVKSVLVSSAGALLMGNSMDTVPLPSYVAPFLTKVPSGNDLVRYTDTGSALVVEWREHVPFDDAELPELVFQTELRSDGTISFVYQNILDKLIDVAHHTGYPVVVGLQDAFARPNFKDGRVMDFYIYPGISIPPSKLTVNSSTEWVKVELTPDKDRVCANANECKNGCELCDNKCVSVIEMARHDLCNNNDNDKKLEECPVSCPIEVSRESVVCGSDGITYASACELRWVACTFNVSVDVDHAGVCHDYAINDDGNDDNVNNNDDDDDENEDDPCDADCDTTLTPVCADSRALYRNECVMRLTSCKLNVRVSSHISGLCQGRARNTCPQYCSSDHAPVCASNGVTYRNECLLKQLICQRDLKDLKIIKEGGCSNSDNSKAFAITNCLSMHKSFCFKEMNPVCGSDGNTYDNECVLNAKLACSNDEHVLEMTHLGACETPAMAHLQLQSSSMFTKVVKGVIFVSLGIGIGLMAVALIKVYRNYGLQTIRGPQLSFDIDDNDGTRGSVVTISREPEEMRPTDVPDRSKYDRLVLVDQEGL